MYQCFRTSEAGAGHGGAMESETIKKTKSVPKSQMSRRNLKFFALIIFLVAGIVAIKSCKGDKDNENGQVSQSVIDEVNKPEVFTEKEVWAEKVEIVSGSERSTTVGHNDPDPGNPPSSLLKASGVDCFAYNTTWSCVTKRYSASQNPDDFVMFNPLASVLWPGNLVQGESLASGIPTSIPVTKRQSGNISLAIVTSGSSGATMYRTVDKMQYSYVNQAMNDILSGFSGQGAARYNFEMDIVKSSDHLEFLLNASFAGWGASVRAGFGTNSTDNKTRIMVKLHQSYFTMVYDDPAGLDGVFTPDITVNDLRNYTGNGNPICYISSVTYGRMYYLLFESSASEYELTQALNAAYKGFGVTVGVDEELKIKNTLEKTTARVFQMGGGGAGGITAGMAVNLESIRDFLEKGINFNAENTGAPISYTVKYLKNAQIVRMNNAMEYELPDCVPETTPNVCDELPQLTTNAVETFTATTATLGGYITLEGTPKYSERGVCYATTPYPILADNKTIIQGTGLGGFSTSVSGLIPNTTYYVRAYAINTEGTAYGDPQMSFTTPVALPVLNTSSATNITVTGATLGGSIINAGTPAYYERGVVYATTPDQTIANQKTIIDGTGTGDFSKNIGSLTPNTTYYVRAYATNTDGTAYGAQVSFTTLNGLPVLTTLNATGTTPNSATLGGNITNVGTPAYTERGVVFATTEKPTVENCLKKIQISGSGTGNFTEIVTGLTPNTTYYVQAYAINTDDTAYGGQISFTTLEGLPVLTTLNATAPTSNSATLGGNITNVGTPAYTERGVVFATTENPTIGNCLKKIQISGSGTGNFTENVTGLTDNTTYYVRAYAINTAGEAYGQQVSFTTGTKLMLTTSAVTIYDATTATLGGNITNAGNPAYTERGVVYALTEIPETAIPGTGNTKRVITGTGTGVFSYNVTGLTANTKYYVRAYATNTEGTVYGEQMSFTTEGMLPTLTTNTVTDITVTTATLGGNITNVGTPTYSERGVVWATTQNPTIYDGRRAIAGNGTGNFTTSVTGLTAGTPYYVRAYAISAARSEPIYGNQIIFTTPTLDRQYIENGALLYVPDNITIADYTENLRSLGTAGATTWVRVNGTKNSNGRITINGDVKIILMDNSHLNAISGGINVASGNTLTIYVNSIEATGKITSTGSNGNDGTVTASGGLGGGGGYAGIGGNAGQSPGNITINGGTIIATGGNSGNGARGAAALESHGGGGGGGGAGAGIGGGGGNGGNGGTTGAGGSTGGNSGTITINSGNITATGGAHGNGGTAGDPVPIIGTGGSGAGGGGGRAANIGGGGGGGGGGMGSNRTNGSGGNSTVVKIGNGGNGGNGGGGGTGGAGGNGAGVRQNGGTIN